MFYQRTEYLNNLTHVGKDECIWGFIIFPNMSNYRLHIDELHSYTPLSSSDKIFYGFFLYFENVPETIAKSLSCINQFFV